MIPTLRSWVARGARLAVLCFSFAGTAAAQQATTTGAVRGVVTGPDGGPLASVTVIATNAETGVRRGGQSDPAGRYQIPFLDPGRYTIRAQMIGFRPTETPNVRIGLGQVEKIDFKLETAATQLSAVTVSAATTPLIETQKTGASARIDEQQIQQLPTNGRNFKDLVVLTPGVSDVSGGGAGGGQSIGGGRTAASNLLMDGVNNNEQYFGGDARGGDRAPFSYSIEAVKEIQVITAGYDVERGNFTGGTVNAVTKSGTNEIRGAIFDYGRQAKIGGLKTTARDFNRNLPVDYKSQQYGFALGGPIVKDRAHFFFTFDQQRRTEPRPVFDASAGTFTTGSPAFRFAKDTLARILQVAKDSLGYDLASEVGAFKQKVNETALFGRVDWQLGQKHTLTVRDNYMQFQQDNDRVTTAPSSFGDFVSNGGPYKTSSNSVVGSLTSAFTSALTNELRAQVAYEDKPRPSNPSGQFGVAMPQVTISGIGSAGRVGTTGVVFGADPVLHANVLNTKTMELIDNVRWALGSHTVKVGANLNRVHVYNDFFLNSLGSFTYNSLTAFEQNRPTSFTRALPFIDESGHSLGNPIAEFTSWDGALYVQDEWQATTKLFLQYGVRYDAAYYPDKAPLNAAVTAAFPSLRTDKTPTDKNNVAPRVGFTYDISGNGSQVVRGGTGLFYGRTPFVFMGNVLSNTGRSQLSLSCTAAGSVPRPDFKAYAQSTSAIPTTCVGGGAASAGTPTINVFSSDFQQSYAWKSNIGYDREIARGWRAGVEAVYSATRDNYLVTDANFNAAAGPKFFADGKIPVYVDASTITTSNGSLNRRNSRVNTAFDNAFVQNSLGKGNSWQAIASLTGRVSRASMTASYTYDHTYDNGSVSCCIAGSDVFAATRVVGNPNDVNAQWGRADFSRPHTIVISPSVDLPYGFLVSGIYRGFSGRPFTPRYQFDVNGDGQANDRVYVPTTAEIAAMNLPADAALGGRTPAAVLDSLIAANDCLSSSRGDFAARNACHNPWQNILDARVSKKFNTLRGQNIELVADFFNVLNGLKKSWGRRVEVASTDQILLVPSAFDATTKKYSYRVNPTFATATPTQFTLTQQFQMQLGARYSF